ncbi:hypothetical protein MMC07_009779 [Pseudocyphellaria aurata]|nr:hypothetical protein [Pseudocyphellaria aurata]
MKILRLIPALLGLAAASPIQNVGSRGLENLSDLSNTVSKRLSLSDTRNELSECRPVTVMFARGTVELGNVGALVGPPFFNALGRAIGDENLGVQGVEYPATFLDYLEGDDAEGAAMLASLLGQAVSLCPSTQIVLSGYSQGARLVHHGVAQTSASVAERVAAVALFGDPYDGRPLPNIAAAKVKTFCFVEDLICKNTIIVDAFHFAYSIYAIPAALFVQSMVEV